MAVRFFVKMKLGADARLKDEPASAPYNSEQGRK